MVGFCYQNLGRLDSAILSFLQQIKLSEENSDRYATSVGYLNLANIYLEIGEFKKAEKATRNSLNQVSQIPIERTCQEMKIKVLAMQGWIAYLQSKSKSKKLFNRAENLEREIDSNIQYLYSLRGIWHAKVMMRSGRITTARAMTQANLEGMKKHQFIKDIASCECLLGDICAVEGNMDVAEIHYNEALRIARIIDNMDVRIEALLGRGRFYAVHRRNGASAKSDLNEALRIALKGEYRLYEADIRVALGWAHLRLGDNDSARDEAQSALTMSRTMGYHWGAVDAEEVLSALG